MKKGPLLHSTFPLPRNGKITKEWGNEGGKVEEEVRERRQQIFDLQT